MLINHKTRILTFILLFTLAGCTATKKLPEKLSLTINYSFTNSSQEYNYLNRIKVFIDGQPAGESVPKKQNEPNTLTLPVKPGNHFIYIVDQVYLLEKWEDRLVSNDYSINCNYSSNVCLTENKTIELVFDLSSGTKVIE